jgi:hypothetical protein
MNRSLLAAFSLTSLAALSPLSLHQAQAGSGIQRCQAANGEAVYTDKTCAAFGAQAVPMSGELLTRIASEQRRDTVDASLLLAPATGTEREIAAAPGRRSAADGCARTPTQLAMDLRGGFALGDVNRIAESYHWVGMSSRAALPVMQRLEQLSERQVVDTHYYDAQIIGGLQDWSASTAAITTGGGILQVTFAGANGVATITDFDVHRQAGCYFVRF